MVHLSDMGWLTSGFSGAQAIRADGDDIHHLTDAGTTSPHPAAWYMN